MGDVARKVMGDAPIAYIEGAGGTRVSEDERVSIGKYDVSTIMLWTTVPALVASSVITFCLLANTPYRIRRSYLLKSADDTSPMLLYHERNDASL